MMSLTVNPDINTSKVNPDVSDLSTSVEKEFSVLQLNRNDVKQ